MRMSLFLDGLFAAGSSVLRSQRSLESTEASLVLGDAILAAPLMPKSGRNILADRLG
jgi:hypothetical protein